jgi:endoglucanase
MAVLFVSVLSCLSLSAYDGIPQTKDHDMHAVVKYFGPLQVKGNAIVGQHGLPVVLHGMSLFWSEWGGKFYNAHCIRWLRDDWKCTVVRAVCGIRSDGYLGNPERERVKIETVIDACIDLGIYVVVDWHDHSAENHLQQSKIFFGTIAKKYGGIPNIIYEIYNEPLKVSWKDVVKPYAEEVVKVIRQYDPHNLIIVGTPQWSQDVDVAADLPIIDTNIAYAFHFYSSDRWHKQNFRNKVITALQKGAPIFVTEYGLSESDGNGSIDTAETARWFSFLDQYTLSTCNWSVIDKNETSSALILGANPNGFWKDADLTISGKIIRSRIRILNGPLFDIINPSPK